MTQDEAWIKQYQEVKTFIEINKRNPSKHDDEERGTVILEVKEGAYEPIGLEEFLSL